ncbi:hypothetical protein GBAR_LOCUS2260 [Geodia barretti]|uniref:Uncharacterized protein n=1 Tax=Geodia barretti TaxID=519541 RepID=A0AA35W2N2_GEOBA|nr:hypothetical protein GBAR_LOCUS2260 [Geodia barretti]
MTRSERTIRGCGLCTRGTWGPPASVSPASIGPVVWRPPQIQRERAIPACGCGTCPSPSAKPSETLGWNT